MWSFWALGCATGVQGPRGSGQALDELQLEPRVRPEPRRGSEGTWCQEGRGSQREGVSGDWYPRPARGRGREGAGMGRRVLAGLCREQGLTDRKQCPLLCLLWAEPARRQQATRSPGDDSSSVALLQAPARLRGRPSPAPPTGALLQPRILSLDPTRHGRGSCERLKSCGSSTGARPTGVTWPQGSPEQNTEQGCQAGL